MTRRLESDGASDTVALLVNLSGRNSRDQLPDALKAATVYELTLDGVEPSPLFLNTRTDLERFTAEYIRALALIRYAHPGIKRLHLFPAVPAPVAVTIGRMRLPKVDPPLLVYDRDHRAGGFTPTLETT